MANKTILELPVLPDEDIVNYWVLGSQQGDTEDDVLSARYKLTDYLMQLAAKFQRVRVLLVDIHTAGKVVHIGEDLTIRKIIATNVTELTINEVEIGLTPIEGVANKSEVELSMDVTIESDMHIAITHTLSDSLASLYIITQLTF